MEKNNFTTTQLSDLMIKIERAYQYSGLAKEEEDPNEKIIASVKFLNEMLGEFYGKVFNKDLSLVEKYVFRVISVFNALNNISESAADTWMLMACHYSGLLIYYRDYESASSTDGGWFRPSSKEKALTKLRCEFNSRVVNGQKFFKRLELIKIVDFYNQYLGKEHTIDEIAAKLDEKSKMAVSEFSKLNLDICAIENAIEHTTVPGPVKYVTFSYTDIGKLYYVGALRELSKLKEKNNSLL